MAIPQGYEGVRPRSGLVLKYGLTVANSPGTIDSTTGAKSGLFWSTWGYPYTIERGDRIAQMIFAPVQRVTFIETEELDATLRGDGGFGHTGN